MIKLLYTLVLALPEIFKLIKEIEKRQKEKATARKVKEDISKIKQAFKDDDAEALNNIFNS